MLEAKQTAKTEWQYRRIGVSSYQWERNGHCKCVAIENKSYFDAVFLPCFCRVFHDFFQSMPCFFHFFCRDFLLSLLIYRRETALWWGANYRILQLMLSLLQRVSTDSTVTMLVITTGTMPTAKYPNPPFASALNTLLNSNYFLRFLNDCCTKQIYSECGFNTLWE